MQVRWFKKRILYIAIMAVIFYFLLRPQEKHYKSTFVINNSKAIKIWEFVADFSNMKQLIPNMLDFSILNESGNYDHWHYSTYYREFLQYLPFIHYINYGHFDIKPEKGEYVIRSNHSTCFISDLLCVGSTSEFWFTQQGIDTLCEEDITYKCPLIFTALCLREVASQRKAISLNLQKRLAGPPVITRML